MRVSLGEVPSAKMVMGTDRIATVRRRLVLQAEKVLSIKLWPSPLEVPTLVHTWQWHRHRDVDPALQWLREFALRVGRAIQTRSRAPVSPRPSAAQTQGVGRVHVAHCIKEHLAQPFDARVARTVAVPLHDL